MTFSSATKPLTYYIDTPGTHVLTLLFGLRLPGLSKREKFQLCGVIAEYLAVMVEDPSNGEGDEDWTLLDHESHNQNDIANNVYSALKILVKEDCESLAALLPVIAEYARDDQ